MEMGDAETLRVKQSNLAKVIFSKKYIDTDINNYSCVEPKTLLLNVLIRKLKTSIPKVCRSLPQSHEVECPVGVGPRSPLTACRTRSGTGSNDLLVRAYQKKERS